MCWRRAGPGPALTTNCRLLLFLPAAAAAPPPPQNLRGLVTVQGPAEARLPGGMRTQHAWVHEVSSRGQLAVPAAQSTRQLHTYDGGWQAVAGCSSATPNTSNCTHPVPCTCIQVQQSKNQSNFRGQLGSKLEQSNKAYKVGGCPAGSGSSP